MDKYTNDYYVALVKAPPIYVGAIQYEYTNPASHIPGAKEFKKSPVKFIPDVLDGEIFLQITHSELIPNIMPGRYYISSFGRVFDMYRMKYLPGIDNGNGYYNVKLTYIIDNMTLGYKTIYIHQLVNYFFNYNNNALELELECNHKDLNKENNRADNLEWTTKDENKYHQILTHQQQALDPDFKNNKELISSCHAKITPQIAIKICELLSQGYSVPTIAKTFGVHESTVTEIKYRRTWVYISKDYNFNNCADGRTGDNVDINKIHDICKLLVQNQDIEYIYKTTNIDKAIISAIKYNGLYPEIRKIYGIHHYLDK